MNRKKKYIYILSQVFPPDSASVSQHLGDLVEELTKYKVFITVLTANTDYEDPNKKYKSFQSDNLAVKRIPQIYYDKKSFLSRAISFIYFNFSLFVYSVLVIKRNSTIVSLTTPPMLPAIVSFIAFFKGSKQVNWLMDLQPELALANNDLTRNLFTNCLLSLSKSSYRNANLNIVLDKHMKSYLKECNVHEKNIAIHPVWSPVEDYEYIDRLKNPFRVKNNFGDRFVVMYSGNHSAVHPLSTLLESAKLLHDRKQILFVFIGGGVRVSEVKEFSCKHNLTNIVQLPYQPRSQIKYSLSSGDMHVVVMGDSLVGYTHPNKVYGALNVGKPLAFIGPSKSHVSDIIAELSGNISVRHGESKILAEKILKMSELDNNEIQKLSSMNKRASHKYKKYPLVRNLVEDILNLAEFK